MQTDQRSFRILVVLGLTAFCSICYELLIAQTIALAFGGTVSAYTLTIGLFLFAMGIGSLIADHVRLTFLDIELLITSIGLLAPTLILSFASLPDLQGVELLGAKIIAYTALVVLGILTGLEIPVAFRLLNDDRNRTQAIAVDYFGSFAAGIVFAFIMFPLLGLAKSILAIAFVNLGVALLTVAFGIEKISTVKKVLASMLAVLLIAISINHQKYNHMLSSFLISDL